MTGKSDIEFDEMSGEEIRARERRFKAFREKYLRCERCGSYDVQTRFGTQPQRWKSDISGTMRICKRCGLQMQALSNAVALNQIKVIKTNGNGNGSKK